MTSDNTPSSAEASSVPRDAAASTSDSSPADTSSKASAVKKKRPSFWLELPILIIVAVLVAVLVRTFLVQTFYIPSGSMENTLLPNDRVLVNKIVYDFRDPARGEIVVFRPPSSWNGGSKDDYIKRVIGVGGDHVICCDSRGRITVNGTPLNETYIYPGNKPSQSEFDVKVPKGRLFVMGDHRIASSDSRFHMEDRQGTVPVDSVVGRAFAIFWPLGRMTILSVPKTFENVS